MFDVIAIYSNQDFFVSIVLFNTLFIITHVNSVTITLIFTTG